MSSVNFSWTTIHDAVDTLAHMIKPLRPHLVVAVARGGLIPATMLSHRLNLPLETISVSTYEGTRRTLEKPIVVEGWKPHFTSSQVVVVDDIMDSGNTWEAILKEDLNHNNGRGRSNYCCLVKKTEAKFLNMKMFFAQVPQDMWVNFPWEVPEVLS